MKIAGIDEAGKGPVLGPLVIGIFCCDDKKLRNLEKIGVKDSKKLSFNRRMEIYSKIRKLGHAETIKVHAEELDKLMECKTINDILKDCYTHLIKKVDADIYILDSPDVIPKRIANELKKLTKKEVKAFHKADEKCKVVAAASIVAKVERDMEIERIKKSIGDFGSGYASDKKTIKFLRDYLNKHGKFPPHTRMKWKTTSNLMQKDLKDFI